MKNFLISVDSSCDGNIIELEKMDISVIYFSYSYKGKIYKDSLDDNDKKCFYKLIRKDKNYNTSQINYYDYRYYFEKLIIKNKNIIHISLTEGLSNSINQARLAAFDLMKVDKNVHIYVVDPTVASLGSIMLVNEAYKDLNNNLSIEECLEHLNKIRNSINTVYTAETLTYFARGGRINKTAACIGNILSIHPILKCNKNGSLQVISKERGFKNTFKYMIDYLKDTVINPTEQTLYLVNADAYDNTCQLAEKIMREVKFKNYKIYNMGSIITIHAGPGLISVFYFGKNKI